MDKRLHKKDKNVILYPGLVKRLIEKGMDALKEKDGEAAYQFFLSAEEHEPEHPQVLFGKMLSLVELGRLEEAVEHTSELLREGIGDYYDNLQVHISLLVQLGKYQEVVDMLDAVISEDRIPAQYAESFYQLLHFSRQMVGDEEWLHQIQPDSNPVHKDIIHMLESKSLELQSNAILQLKEINHPDATEALISYLMKSDRDLALQSLALKALYEKKYDKPIHIEKQGKKMDVIPSQLDELAQLSFGRRVIDRLSAELEHENPFLFEMTKQLCWAHLFALFPFLPEPKDENFWAAVFHICASERIGMDGEMNEIEERYQVIKKNLLEKVTEVKKLEAMVFQIDSIYSQDQNKDRD
ncbi:tetratricopeptide repeat protein [Halalkalibacter nanhaiisediminis]|uniref:Tetratricopeptide repeat protein n=1 Tax=Halalkalibacter nanhaiisediminis TaxID=688079 RepID=A0A562QLK1_9BACI|nr:tetratricopeptide repeat protein [Halalkalibacter nanhaiisediminis]TWI57070.1 hypothetical protein IQ10_01773 [Halalkalibacter nanhaiisediminis]